MRGSIGSRAVWLLTASFIAAACTSAPSGPNSDTDADPNGEITTPMQRIPEQMDPLRSQLSEQIRHLAMLFEPLMTFDPNTLAPIPAAAREWKLSGDGLTYTFTLRDGLKYSDGTPVLAKDFAYGFSRMCDHALGPPGAAASAAAPAANEAAGLIVGCADLRRLDPKKTDPAELAATKKKLGLRADSDRELVVTLTAPVAYFLALTALPLAYPVRESDVARGGESYGRDAATLIGNGPFKLVQWIPGQRLVFERNEHYRTPPKLKRWTKVVVPLEIALAAYRNNEIDFYGGVPYGRIAAVAENLEAIESDPKIRPDRVDAPTATADLFLLNLARPPFSDRTVRQAFAKAVDREAMIRDFLRYGTAAHTLIPLGLPGYDPGDRFQSFDPTTAKKLLESARLGTGLSGVRFVFDNATTRTPAEILQQGLKRSLGIEIVLEQVDPVTYEAMWKDLLTAPHIRWVRVTLAEPDPHGWFSGFRTGMPGSNASGYRNSEYDRLVAEAGRERDAQRRADLYQRAGRILSEDAPAIWFYWPANVYLRKPRVKGVTDTIRDVEYGLSRVTDIYVAKKR